MDRAAITARLLEHRLVKEAPLAEIDWLAAHGVFREYEPGDLVAEKGKPISDFHVVLSGRFAIHVNPHTGSRRVMEWRGGDLSGQMPYSRMATTPGNSVVEEHTEVLTIDQSLFPEMIRECPVVTAMAVHVMLDRARHFNSAAMQDEKMLSLGRVAAGLAHELNNPASAAVRSAQLLDRGLREVEAAALALGALNLGSEPQAVIDRVRNLCLEGPAPTPRSPLEQSDREDEIGDWLRRHQADDAAAAELADTSVTTETLEQLAGALDREALNVALRWLVASCSTRSLTHELERSASRMHQLVSSIKRFTYMDRAPVPEPVDVGQLLEDTVTVLAPSARAKSISLKLEIEPDLPSVTGFGGELNQVWMNLIDNAIDAAPVGGSVTVSARREPGFLAVRVRDNGPGIPDEVRPKIFDPFFTTKPPGQGTGLGLDIVQRIARGHRAELDVSSEPGRTEFRVGLPLGDGQGPATRATE